MIDFSLLVVAISSLTWIWSACRPWDLERLFRRVAFPNSIHGPDGESYPIPVVQKVSHDVGLANAPFHESMMVLDEGTELSRRRGSCNRFQKPDGLKGFFGGTTKGCVVQKRTDKVAIDRLVQGR